MKVSKSTILIFSGGMDSATLLYELLYWKCPVKALGINYGQRHVRELKAAEQIAALRGVEYRVLDFSCLRPLLAGSSQTDSSVEVPEGHYAAENMKLTVVPNRNMIMLSAAIAWAISTKSEAVAYAAHFGDHAIYPDCREEFVMAMEFAAKTADWHPVEILRPFINWTKQRIAERGVQLGVPYHITWSCYKGGAVHCGKCGTCVERREAFRLALLNDPTEYQCDP